MLEVSRGRNSSFVCFRGFYNWFVSQTYERTTKFILTSLSPPNISLISERNGDLRCGTCGACFLSVILIFFSPTVIFKVTARENKISKFDFFKYYYPFMHNVEIILLVK